MNLEHFYREYPPPIHPPPPLTHTHTWELCSLIFYIYIIYALKLYVYNMCIYYV